MITDEQVLDALIESLRERGPDFRYEKEEGRSKCTYSTADEEPSCLVGMVMHKIAPEHFAKIAATEQAEIARGAEVDLFNDAFGVSAFHVAVGLDLSMGSLSLLSDAQGAQDTGYTYREVAQIIKVEAF